MGRVWYNVRMDYFHEMFNTTDPYENDMEELGAREAWEDSRDYADQDDPAHEYTDADFDDSAADQDDPAHGWTNEELERGWDGEGDFEDRVYLD